MASKLEIDGYSFKTLAAKIDPTDTWFQHEIHNSEHYANTHGGLMRDNLATDYARAKWELDEKRFDRWHPILSKYLQHDHNLRCEIGTPPVLSCNPTPTPKPNPCGSIPEPTSFALLAIAICMLLFQKRFVK